MKIIFLAVLLISANGAFASEYQSKDQRDYLELYPEINFAVLTMTPKEIEQLKWRITQAMAYRCKSILKVYMDARASMFDPDASADGPPMSVKLRGLEESRELLMQECGWMLN